MTTTRWKVLTGTYEGVYTKVVSENHNDPFYALVYTKEHAEQIVREHNLAQAAEAMREALEHYIDSSPCRNKCKPTDMTCSMRKAQAALRLAKGE